MTTPTEIAIAVYDGTNYTRKPVATEGTHGVWAVHGSPKVSGSPPMAFAITHVPRGARVLTVYSRTAALAAMALLDPTYDAGGVFGEGQFRPTKPGGWDECIAFLNADRCLYTVPPGDSLDDALERLGFEWSTES